jgi:hypothetical protein
MHWKSSGRFKKESSGGQSKGQEGKLEMGSCKGQLNKL